MRFHVDTLIGLPDGSKLPSPTATTFNNSANSPPHPSTSTAEASIDPCFPYKNGPGHKDATPQQLKIMHKMLDDAGLKSFRPNFAKSVSVNENRSIWNVCLKIFNKLVECGEYDGVATGGKHDTFNKKCLDTYARSVSKRYVHLLVVFKSSHQISIILCLDTACNPGTQNVWKNHKQRFVKLQD